MSGSVGIGSYKADVIGFVYRIVGYFAVKEYRGFAFVFALLREVVARSLEVYRVDY